MVMWGKIKPIALSVPLLLLAACAGTGSRHQQGTAAKTGVYLCGDYEFLVHTRGDRASLYLPHSEHELERVAGTSKTRYRGEGVTLTLKEGRASVELDNYQYLDCDLDRRRVPWEEARRRGVDFRAVGQEPGWYLEVDHDRQTLFVYNYGNSRFLAPTPEPMVDESVSDGAVTVYELGTGGKTMRVELRVEHCQDSMSGEVFDNSARVVIDTREYRGCGMALDPHW